MHFFAFSSILIVISTLSMAIILFLSTHKPKENIIWAYFCISVSIWGFGGYFGSMTLDKAEALFWWQIANVGSVFCPIVFYHFILEYLKHKKRLLLKICYLAGIVLTVINFFFSDLYLGEISIIFDQFYYMDWVKDKNIAYLLFYVGFYWLLLIYSFALLIREFLSSKGNRRNQMKYFIVGMSIGWLGGCADFMVIFGIPVYPYSNILIAIYPLILGFAMSRFRLMDIELVFTRLGTFVLVYSLVLGFPLALTQWGQAWLTSVFDEKWFWAPISLLVVLASAGPFIFLYIQRKAEDRILQEERRIQDLLVQASYGMNTIHDLQKLLRLIIVVTMKTLRVDMASVYLLDQSEGQYVSKAADKDSKFESKISFHKDDSLIQLLRKGNHPLVHDELKILSDMKINDTSLHNAVAQMQELSSEVIIPITISDRLLGFIVLGERPSKQQYSKELLNTLSVLGNQTALAVEDCNRWEAETKRIQEEGLKERTIALEYMASSIAHEIDNPMHIVQQSLGYMKNFLLTDSRVAMPGDIKDDFDESIRRTQGAAQRVSEMVKAILDYSRMGTAELKSVRINEAVTAFLHLMQPQIKQERVNFTHEVEDNLPPVLADKIQLEEIFVNFVRNSFHAVRELDDKQIRLKIFLKDKKTVRIECSDNGYGIDKKIITDIFLPSTTTKGSSEGTGLGLYRVRKIVDLYQGKVWAESEGPGKGTTFIVELPVYEENNDITNNNDK